MKEQWTQDLQKKMSNYEVPTIPEGLWEDIDSAIGEIPSKTAKKAALFPHWKKACAAILLLLLIPTALLFLNNNKENEALVGDDSIGSVPQPTAPISPDAPTSSPIAPVLHIAKPLAQKAPITSKPSLVLAQSPAPQEEEKEAPTPTPEDNQSEKEQATSTPQTPQSVEATQTAQVLPSEDAPIFKQEKQDGIYLAMNASGINFSSEDVASEPLAYMNEPLHEGNWDPIYNSSDGTTYHEETHHRPITIGLQVGIPVADKWSVVTGLTYTYLHSDITDGTRFSHTLTDQKLHFVGIPLQMNYQLYNNHYCNIYLGTGGRIDFGVSGKTNHEDHLSHLPVNYSLKAAAGVQVNLFKSLNIYAEPSVQYNIPGSTRYKTYYTEHKTMFDLQLGIRIIP
jgi:hypothetical protein